MQPLWIITLQVGFPTYWLLETIEVCDGKTKRIAINAGRSASSSLWVCIPHWPLCPNSELHWTSLYGNRTKREQKQKEHGGLKPMRVAWKVERFVRRWLGTVVNRVERLSPFTKHAPGECTHEQTIIRSVSVVRYPTIAWLDERCGYLEYYLDMPTYNL